MYDHVLSAFKISMCECLWDRYFSVGDEGWNKLTAVFNFAFSTDLQRIQTPSPQSLFRAFTAIISEQIKPLQPVGQAA